MSERRCLHQVQIDWIVREVAVAVVQTQRNGFRYLGHFERVGETVAEEVVLHGWE